APRRITPPDPTEQNLETEQHPSDQSSAATFSGLVRPGPPVAGVSSFVRQREGRSRRNIFPNSRSPILEIALRVGGKRFAGANGTDRRISGGRHSGQRRFPILAC